MGQSFCRCNYSTETGDVIVPIGDNTLENNNQNKGDEENVPKDIYNNYLLKKSGININKDDNFENIQKNINQEKEKMKNIKLNILKNRKNLLIKFLAKNTEEISEEKFEEYTKPNIKKIEENLGDIKNKIKENQKNDEKYIIEKGPLLFNGKSMIYKGSWNIRGKKEGFGILIDNNGNKYTGEWKDDKFDGYGRIISINGAYYEGYWFKGVAEGKGTFYSSKMNFTYIGEFKNNFFHGKGKETFSDNTVYEGMFSNGLREGEGKYIYSDSSYYTGNFKNNQYNGNGTFKWKDGRFFIGSWKNNQMNGKGEFHWDKENKYIGEYKNNCRGGFGIYNYKNDYYEGKWVNGLPHGEGKMYKNGETFSGLFRYGKLISRNNNTISRNRWNRTDYISPEKDEKNHGTSSESKENLQSSGLSKKSSIKNYPKGRKLSSSSKKNVKKKPSFSLPPCSKSFNSIDIKSGFLEKSKNK